MFDRIVPARTWFFFFISTLTASYTVPHFFSLSILFFLYRFKEVTLVLLSAQDFYEFAFIIFIWNRQRKRSFPACEAAVKMQFIVPRQAAKKPLERGSTPDGAFAPWTPFSAFGNVKFVTIKMWYYPACARAQFDFRSSADKFAFSLPYFR